MATNFHSTTLQVLTGGFLVWTVVMTTSMHALLTLDRLTVEEQAAQFARDLVFSLLGPLTVLSFLGFILSAHSLYRTSRRYSMTSSHSSSHLSASSSATHPNTPRSLPGMAQDGARQIAGGGEGKEEGEGRAGGRGEGGGQQGRGNWSWLGGGEVMRGGDRREDGEGVEVRAREEEGVRGRARGVPLPMLAGFQVVLKVGYTVASMLLLMFTGADGWLLNFQASAVSFQVFFMRCERLTDTRFEKHGMGINYHSTSY